MFFLKRSENYKNIFFTAFLFVVVFAVLKMFALKTAFHVDTMIYVNAVKSLMVSGKLPVDFFFHHRIVNVWLYFPFFYLFGMNGVAWITIILYMLFGVFYVSCLTKGFGKLCALFSFLLVSLAPATLVTVTHLKEDYNALLFCFIALLMAVSLYRNYSAYSKRQQYLFSSLIGLFFSLSLLCKETVIFSFAAPFVFVLFSDGKQFFTKAKFLNISLILLGVCVGILVLCPDYINQFLKLVSGDEFYRIKVFSFNPEYWKFALQQMGKGFYTWWIFFPGFFYGVYLLIKQRKFMLLIFPSLFFIYLFFLGGSNGFWLRLTLWIIVWSLPVAVYGMLSFVDIFKGRIHRILQIVIFLLFVFAAVLNFKYMYPLFDLRKNINFMESFYTNCLAGVPDGSVVLGMDNLDVLAFFEGDRFIYKKHSINVTEKKVNDFIADLQDVLKKGKRIFMLPDFFTYSENLEKYFKQQLESSFSIRKEYVGIYSIYHRMDYFLDYDEHLKSFAKKKNAKFLEKKDTGIILLNNSGSKLEIKEISFEDPTGKILLSKVFLYKNIVVPLKEATVYELKLKK